MGTADSSGEHAIQPSCVPSYWRISRSSATARNASRAALRAATNALHSKKTCWTDSNVPRRRQHRQSVPASSRWCSRRCSTNCENAQTQRARIGAHVTLSCCKYSAIMPGAGLNAARGTSVVACRAATPTTRCLLSWSTVFVDTLPGPVRPVKHTRSGTHTGTSSAQSDERCARSWPGDVGRECFVSIMPNSGGLALAPRCPPLTFARCPASCLPGAMSLDRVPHP